MNSTIIRSTLNATTSGIMKSAGLVTPTAALANATMDESQNMANATTLSPLSIGPISIFPVYIPVFVWVLGPFCLGILINAFILFTMVRKRSTLLITRLDHIMTLLIFLFFSWSITCVVEWIVNSWDVSDWVFITQGTLSCIFVVLIFATNLMLSLERHFIICERPDETTDKYFTAIIIITGLLSWLIIWVFATSPVNLPTAPKALKITLRGIYAFIIVTIVATVTLYINTYLKSSNILKKYNGVIAGLVEQETNLKHSLSRSQKSNKRGRDEANFMRLQLERKILINCMLMAATLVFCYTPALLLNLAPLIDPHMSADAYELWANVAEMFLSLDVVLTPLMVLRFRPDVCDAFGLRSKIRNNSL
ncbi:hypothetical protein HDU98_003384 [Podochytrium sp. JEL0797]|nr:hypothetical protein HDU98_003384 [Podochytrium sp. JEL0797]